MNNTIITEVKTHKHLGVFPSSNGDWKDHINYLITKTSPKINILRSFKFTLDRFCLQTLYFTLIRPILEYSDIVWDCLTKAQSDLLEDIQLEAARIVTGATKLTSRVKLYTETGWLPLQRRREQHKIIQFHKMVHGLVPQFLHDILPPRNSRIHDHNTRVCNNFRPIACRSSLYQKSFLPSVISLWNSLPELIKRDPSISRLKGHLNESNIKIPSFYYCGSRIGQIHHARLRMECSSLNFYLFRRNLVNSPSCPCNDGDETNEHFLLHCRLFSQLRTRAYNEITCPISTQILLFGNDELSYNENVRIFTCVQSFIISAKRFN